MSIVDIVLIEDDWRVKEITLGDLRIAFAGAHIQSFSCVGDFLMKFNELPQDYILILEHHLTLLHLGKNSQEMDERYRQLTTIFPWVGEEWNHQGAGEKVVRHVRTSSPNIGILIYTHSDFEQIAEDVRSDPKVRYLRKDLKKRAENLRGNICALTQ